ncbi:MAG TPA: YhjD/YihY/BrkB family envelope integrity protein, partial [Candidatus Acidoferrales bacterium]|nr:YhjD/YihY/BrkB family envelope integrity protein [Candidatus Acidoferrales bacterium]
ENFAHFWGYVGRGFVQNRCLIRASALSYTTLLAMIPLLAIAISITSSLLKKQGEQDIYKAIDHFISSVMPPATVAVADLHSHPYRQPSGNATNTDETATNTTAALEANSNPEDSDTRVAVQNVVAKNIHEFIHNTRAGTLGFTGVAVLLFVALSMLNSIEGTFNDIWGIQRGRDMLVRVGRFWFALSLGPILIAVGVGLAGSSHFQSTRALLQATPIIGLIVVQAATLIFIWLVFAFIYQFVPNAKVNFSAALAGGITGGTLWHLNNLFGFLYVSRVVGSSRIYGGIGLIPVFMAGLYLSWAILLFGAQTAYAFQNRKIYLLEKAMETVTHRDREIIALRLMTSIGRRFQNGEPPAVVTEIADEITVPTKLVQKVLQALLEGKIVTEIAGNAAFTPARPLDAITVHDILRAMRIAGGESTALPGDRATTEVLEEFHKIENAERAAAAPVTLLALVQRSQKPK